MDDLISRKALDREMSMQLVHAGFKSYSDAGQMYLKAKQIVRSAPAIDAAPVVRGEWKEWWPGSCALIMTGEEVLYRCTRCSAKYADTSNFCPNCGAEMDGGNDND